MAGGLAGRGHSQSFIEPGGVDPPADKSKPPYRVPSMAEVNAVPWNGLTVVSTFAGCGGSSTGYRMAGYRVLWANEFVPMAQASYRANWPNTILDCRDIKKVTAADILRATGLRKGELDVLDGSPPCQAFSTAGKRARGWGEERKYEHGASQKNEDLFQEYIRLLRGLMPRAFVAENVSGLVKGVAKGYFVEILRGMKAAGYRVEARIVDAQWCGVPQTRQRVIFVGVRGDLDLAPAFPAPLPYRYSVREAIPWLSQINMGGHGFMQERRQDGTAPAPAVMASGLSSYKYDVEAVIESADGYHCHAKRTVDQPMPTIQAGRPVNIEVTHGSTCAHSSDRGKKLDVDKPLTAVLARGDGRGGAQFDVKVREINLDGQIPCIVSNVANDQFRVVHDSGRKNVPAKDVTDRPCPTIGAGPEAAEGGGPRNHFKVGRYKAPKSMNDPAPTVQTHGRLDTDNEISVPINATERRKFTIPEVIRLCAFPDDYALVGTYAQQWERLGNSVPPLMMMRIAEAVRDRILLPARARTAGRAPRLTGRR